MYYLIYLSIELKVLNGSSTLLQFQFQFKHLFQKPLVQAPNSLLLLFLFYFLTLQYCIGFAIYQHESTTGIHVFPILNPPPSPYHPSGSYQCTSPKHPVSCMQALQVAPFVIFIFVLLLCWRIGVCCLALKLLVSAWGFLSMQAWNLLNVPIF